MELNRNKDVQLLLPSTISMGRTMNYRNCAFVFLISFLCVVGCSHEGEFISPPQISHRYSDATNWENSITDTDKIGSGGVGWASNESEEDAERPQEVTDTTSIERRVIFESNIDLRVDNFDGVESKVSGLVDRHGGFISEANVSHQAAQAQTGYWTIRVPVNAYRQLLDSAGSSGELESRRENANDVTAEFYDLEARIKNKQRLEERIVKLLDEADSDLRKMIEVENELARVREEIERMQGKLRLLSDVTGMSTIHLTIIEQEEEPATAVAATFSDRIANAWNSALTQATNTFQDAIVACVENVFRIAIFVTTFTIVWLVARIFISRVNRRESLPAS